MTTVAVGVLLRTGRSMSYSYYGGEFLDLHIVMDNLGVERDGEDWLESSVVARADEIMAALRLYRMAAP